MGKLHKGLNELGQGCAASSIPTKYQTVIISNEEKKGFSSQTKRFRDHLNENPGPGSYVSHTAAEGCSPSFSKRGTGSFASKAGRVPRSFPRLQPGPDAYNLQTSLLLKHDFNRGESRMFRPPLAVKRETQKSENPAPNQYDVLYNVVNRNSTVSAQCAFRSKTRRTATLTDNFKGPSPCHYKVSEVLVQKTPLVPISCFKSTTARIQSPVRNNIPGPGTYNPYQPPEPVKRNILPRRHYLGLSAPPLIPAKDPPFPGPGHYDIVNNNPPAKHLVSSAAFLSGTSRWIQEDKGQDIPGPASELLADMNKSKHSQKRRSALGLTHVWTAESQHTQLSSKPLIPQQLILDLLDGEHDAERDVLQLILGQWCNEQLLWD